MKRMKKQIIGAVAAFIHACAVGAVTQRWEVETSRVQPVSFEAVRGETLALEAVFKSYGRPVEMPENGCCILWQTNGMGSAWWQAPAQVEGGRLEVEQRNIVSNVVRAVFTPAMDPGAGSVVGFLGATGQNYRAAFTIRFRHGPGSVPNALDTPPRVLDLGSTVVVNPPWPTTNDFQTATNAMRVSLKAYVDEQIEGSGTVTPQAVTNVVDGKVAAWAMKGQPQPGGGGADTNAVNDLIRSYDETNIAARIAAKQDALTQAQTNAADSGITAAKVATYDGYAATIAAKTGQAEVDATIAASNLCTVAASQAMTNGIARSSLSEGEIGKLIYVGSGYKWGVDYAHTSYISFYADDAGNATTASSAQNVEWTGVVNKPTTIAGYGITNAYTKTEADARYAPTSTVVTVNQMGDALAAVSGHLNAEDARFVSTNYDSVVRMPEAYVEIKINNNWQTIWKEMTRWGKFVGHAFSWDTWPGFHAWSTNVTAQLATKAERCWGIYDSETGEISPDGYTQISSSNILIAANMSYKRVVDTANAIWVLESNSGLATLGGTNGYFRVKDGDGNTQFEIIKGNLRELGCDAGGIAVNNTGATPVLTIPYSVVAAEHPTLKICTDLTTADWKSEDEATCAATVAWSGSSGAYVATVTAKSASSAMFVKATYMGGSETIINNIAPTKLQYIYIGNTKYAVGYTTINGTGVMTLTPQ